ncbi:MAG: hypothetical protein K8R68_09680 [Bacteroidales bacterium]|nr:hypothetical protein [Bacteroidales bacterium]
MQNEHNPIYRKIQQLCDFWESETEKNPKYKLARWLMLPDDVDLLVGLLKLESTPHGQLPEVFVVMMTPFESREKFSYHLVKDWIYMYEMEKEKSSDGSYTWDHEEFKDKLKELDKTHNADILLLEMLKSFKQHIDDEERDLVLGIIPQNISSFPAYNFWLNNIIRSEIYPEGVKVLVLDHTGKAFLNDICNNNEKITITLEPGDMDLNGAKRDIATQGNPNDPQVKMRKIMFEMSDAAAKNDTNKLYTLGDELIKIGQHSGQKSFFASVFLIYSGFLMQYKETEKIDELLDRAIKIAKSALPGQTDCIPVLIQLYGFKAANYALVQESEKTIEWYKIQAEFCIEHELPVMAIGAYKNAIVVAEKNKLYEEYEDCSKAGYNLGVDMKNEELEHSEYGFLAFHYYKILQDEYEKEAIQIKERMTEIFGPDWEESSEKTAQQMKSNKPVEA